MVLDERTQPRPVCLRFPGISEVLFDERSRREELGGSVVGLTCGGNGLLGDAIWGLLVCCI